MVKCDTEFKHDTGVNACGSHGKHKKLQKLCAYHDVLFTIMQFHQTGTLQSVAQILKEYILWM